MYLRNGKVGVLDLVSSAAEEIELAEDDNLDSLKIARKLMDSHGQDTLVLGTGALTASFVPAACAGFAMSRRGVVPILGFAGVELKFSGFDFIVFKGRADKRGYVWIRDGMIEFVEADWMASMNSWQRTDKIRSDQGDGKIQVVSVGPWGDSSKDAAQFVVDYWGGEDKIGMGSELGARNLGAIAFRGMGELELKEPEKHFEDAVLLMNEHVQKLGKSEGLLSYTPVVDRDDFKKLVHRVVACYGCPYPCRSYVKVSEDPGEFRLMAKEPGHLHYDVPALSKAFQVGMDARNATFALMACAKAGAEPVSILSGMSSASSSAVETLVGKPSDVKNARAKNFESSFMDEGDYHSAIGLGVCPRYWAKVGFNFKAVSSYAESALDLGPI